MHEQESPAVPGGSFTSYSNQPSPARVFFQRGSLVADDLLQAVAAGHHGSQLSVRPTDSDQGTPSSHLERSVTPHTASASCDGPARRNVHQLDCASGRDNASSIDVNVTIGPFLLIAS